jgi:DNA (cytosine-5)-methyltransferase 1
MGHKGLAINHWAVAVDTMRKNHPDIDTKRMSIEEAVPADLVPGGEVDLLWASPSCTHHSRAKGGKPRSNQLRAQPDLVLSWLDQLYVRHLIVENVPEFVEWGPLNKSGKPIKRLKGSCFVAWVQAIEARNYHVEWRIVNCADYGDATSRRRFFLKAVRKGCGKIHWPEPTHAENPQPDLFGRELKKWRGVRECLDLSDFGRSIFDPDRSLSHNTLRRVAVGMKKYNGMDFLMDMLGSDGGDNSRVHPLSKPMPTQHSGGNRCALVRPFLVRLNKNCNAESVEDPLSTTTTKDHHALCQPFIVKLNNHADAENVEKPLTSVLAGGQHHALCQPVIIDHFKNGKAQSVDEPIGAQTTHDRYSVVSSVLIDMSHPGDKNDKRRVTGSNEPLKTITTRNNLAVCTPLVLGQQGGATARPIDKPCPTIATAGAIRIATPLILDMSRPGGHDSGHVRTADKPIQTLTTCDNVQVAIPVIFDKAVGLPRLPDGRYIDIRLRMLKPSELAAAHSFPKDYVLTGNRGEQVKQIGNSVPVMTAAAMCEADFKEAS